MTHAWLVRAGRHGEDERLALYHGIVLIGWSRVGDLSAVSSRDELFALLRTTFPGERERRLLNHLAQLWAFREGIAAGDLVVLPLKTSAEVAIGRVTGEYAYRGDVAVIARHTRPVEWLTTDLPRPALGQDLLYSLGASMTVCGIRRNAAAARLAELAATGRDPGR